MKINNFIAALSIAIAGIIAFFLSCYVSEENKITIATGSFFALALTLSGMLSLSFGYDRTTTLTRTTSGVFFALILTSQIIFTVLDNFLLPTYVLVTGGLTISFALIIYLLSRSKH